MYEIANATFSRLTPGSRPDWTPDGKRVMYRVSAIFGEVKKSQTGFASKAADLSGLSEVLALHSCCLKAIFSAMQITRSTT